MEALERVCSYKTSSKPMQQIYMRVLAGRSLINSMHSLSTTPLITLPHFLLLNCKRILQVELFNNALIQMQLEVLIIGIFKIFKTKF